MLLKFVCQKYGFDECPECGHELHFLPVKAGCKDRWKCWRCDAFGDVFDVLAWAFPDQGFAWRQKHLAVLRAEYESAGSKPLTNSSVDVESGAKTADRPNDPNALEMAWADFIYTCECEGWKQTDAFQVLTEALGECRDHDIALADLVDRWQQHCETQRAMHRRVSRRLRRKNLI